MSSNPTAPTIIEKPAFGQVFAFGLLIDEGVAKGRLKRASDGLSLCLLSVLRYDTALCFLFLSICDV